MDPEGVREANMIADSVDLVEDWLWTNERGVSCLQSVY